MLKISNSRWVNTVSLVRTVINLYSFWVKIRKAFYSWIPWPATATFSKQTGLKWSFPTKCVCVPSSTCLSRQQSCCAGAGFLFTQQHLPAPAPSGREGGGVPLRQPCSPHSSVSMEDWRTSLRTSQVRLPSQRLLLDMKGLFMTHHDYSPPPFLIQSKVLTVTLLTMDFPRFRSGLNFVFLCNQQCSSRKADHLWPLCK